MLKVNRLGLQDIHQIYVHSLVVTFASLLVIMVGGLVLLGWCFGMEFLKNACYVTKTTMKANSALYFLLSGISLWLLEKGGSHRTGLELGQNGVSRENQNSLRQSFLYMRLARVCTLPVLMIGWLTLSQYLFRWNLGINELLFRDSSQMGMGLNTALNFIFVGVALELLGEKPSRRNYWYIQVISLIAVAIAFLPLIAKIYQVEFVYGLLPYTTSMALPTVLIFFAVYWCAVDAYPPRINGSSNE